MKTVPIYTDGIKTAMRFYAGDRFAPVGATAEHDKSKRRPIDAS